MNCSFVDRQFWTEFIQLYRNNECLWKFKSKEYMDRSKKDAAYEILVKKLKERDSEASIETVKKRINNMRSVFRKEMKKKTASMKSGANSDDVYTPQLWYYNMLLFLKDQEVLKSSVLNLEEEGNEPGSSLQTSPTGTSDQDSTSRPDNEPDIHSFQNRSPPRKKTRKSSPLENKADSVLSMLGERLSSQRREDEFDIVGKNVASKLRKLPSNVEVIAEKLINDVLYEAQMGTLTPHAKVVIEQPTVYYKFPKHSR